MTAPQEEPPPVFHSHCDTCFDIKCFVRPEPNVACDMIRCPRECGSRYHACKTEDHMFLCPNVHVSCTNAWYGCQASKNRTGIRNHLQHCPANVVMCGEEIHRENYHDHFYSEEHEHHCEPRFIKWVEENNAKPIASAFQFGEPDVDVIEQFENLYGPKAPPHKSEKQSDKNDNVDENKREEDSEKESNNNKSEKNQSSFDDLHTVPWQYRQSLSSDVNEIDPPTPDPTSPDEVDPPLSPFTEEPNLSQSLEGLPVIVLQKIGRYLDGESLGKLAVTSKHLRRICSSLLQEKGQVDMRWEKKDGSWQITKKVWYFGSMSLED